MSIIRNIFYSRMVVNVTVVYKYYKIEYIYFALANENIKLCEREKLYKNIYHTYFYYPIKIFFFLYYTIQFIRKKYYFKPLLVFPIVIL